jgi:hypothetical protein
VKLKISQTIGPARIACRRPEAAYDHWGRGRRLGPPGATGSESVTAAAAPPRGPPGPGPGYHCDGGPGGHCRRDHPSHGPLRRLGISFTPPRGARQPPSGSVQPGAGGRSRRRGLGPPAGRDSDPALASDSARDSDSESDRLGVGAAGGRP